MMGQKGVSSRNPSVTKNQGKDSTACVDVEYLVFCLRQQLLFSWHRSRFTQRLPRQKTRPPATRRRAPTSRQMPAIPPRLLGTWSASTAPSVTTTTPSGVGWPSGSTTPMGTPTCKRRVPTRLCLAPTLPNLWGQGRALGLSPSAHIRVKPVTRRWISPLSGKGGA